MTFDTFFYGNTNKNNFLNNFDKLKNILFIYKQIKEWDFKLTSEANLNRIENVDDFKIDYYNGRVFASNFILQKNFIDNIDKFSEDSFDKFLTEMERILNNNVYSNKYTRDYNIKNYNDFVNGAICVFNDVFRLMFTDKASEVLNDLNECNLNYTIWNNNNLIFNFIDGYEPMSVFNDDVTENFYNKKETSEIKNDEEIDEFFKSNKFDINTEDLDKI